MIKDDQRQKLSFTLGVLLRLVLCLKGAYAQTLLVGWLIVFHI